jgi:hypothetical protein
MAAQETPQGTSIGMPSTIRVQAVLVGDGWTVGLRLGSGRLGRGAPGEAGSLLDAGGLLDLDGVEPGWLGLTGVRPDGSEPGRVEDGSGPGRLGDGDAAEPDGPVSPGPVPESEPPSETPLPGPPPDTPNLAADGAAGKEGMGRGMREERAAGVAPLSAVLAGFPCGESRLPGG